MSPAPAWELSYPPTTTQQPPREDDEDAKSPYDDLIDQYATPFRQNSQHKAYTVDPSAFGAADRKATSEAAAKDLEGASSQGHDWAYPPATAKEEKGKAKALTWAAVCSRSSDHTTHV